MNKNSNNLIDCDSCYFCNSCNSCDSCNFCNSCNSCNSCDSCNFCNFCNFCNSCNSCNFCNYSKGLRMSEKMIFCLGDGKYESKGEGYQKHYRVFNKDVEEKEWDEIRKSLDIKISPTMWVEKKDMTDKEKENHPVYKELGGYLKTISYEEAWSNWWKNASDTDKNKILGIKYFDAEIFKGITGIEVNSKKSELLAKADELIQKANELKKEAENL